MPPVVWAPIAKLRETRVASLMWMFAHGPGPTDLIDIASSPTSMYTLAMLTLVDESGSIPSFPPNGCPAKWEARTLR